MTGNNGRSGIKVDKSQFAKFIRKIRLQNNTVLAFNEGTITQEGLLGLADVIGKTEIKGVVLLVVKDVNDMVNLNEEDMNKAGWFKVSALQNAIERMREKESASKAGGVDIPPNSEGDCSWS